MSEDRKREQINEIFEYYGTQKEKNRQETVVSMLRELQEVQGYLTAEMKERTVETMGISPNVLQCLIRMYPSLKEVQTIHQITACTGERCAKKEGMEILGRLRKELGISKTGISKDGAFQLRTQNCLKKCRTSPNLLIDGVIYSGEDLRDIKRLLQRIREKDGTSNAEERKKKI